MRQIRRALDILDHLGQNGDASLAELSASLELPRASVHRMLHTLEERAYVHHSAREKVYRLGPAIGVLAARSTESAIVRAAAPALARLRASTGETVNLAVLNGSRIVYAATLDGTHQPRMSASVGAQVEPHATALGKAILSHLEPEDRDRLLPPAPYPRYTPATITTREALDAELLVVADRGFAVEVEESTLGAACVAVAILGPDGKAIAGISISGVPARLPVGSYPSIVAEVKAWCERIQVQLDDATAPVVTAR
jgi:IclR family transcriptional regulator, acetate operon repressor